MVMVVGHCHVLVHRTPNKILFTLGANPYGFTAHSQSPMVPCAEVFHIVAINSKH